MELLNRLFGSGVQLEFFLKIPSGVRVLELGCGGFDKLKRINGINPLAQLYGCDVGLQPDVPPYVHFSSVNLDKEPLPYEDDFFDVVIMIHVLEHLSNHANAAREAKRVLKKGGLFYVEAPSVRSIFVPSLLFAADQGNPFNFFDDPTHIRPWTKAGLYYYLRGNGFLVVTVGTGRRMLEVIPALGRLLKSIIRRDRVSASMQVWTIVGWSVYGIGKRA